MADHPDASVKVEPKRLADTEWHQHALRFAFGGIITAFAGWMAEKYGPAIGGLFLGFPAILPASLSIVKQKEGRSAAGEDALGAVPGSIGLLAFGLVVWQADSRVPPWLTLVLAALAWLLVATGALLLLLRVQRPAGGG